MGSVRRQSTSRYKAGIIENQVAEIGMRAKRRGGEILAQMERNITGRPPTDKSVRTVPTFSDQIKDAGINRMKASDWQHIAAMPEAEFEEHIERSEVARVADSPGAHIKTRLDRCSGVW